MITSFSFATNRSGNQHVAVVWSEHVWLMRKSRKMKETNFFFKDLDNINYFSDKHDIKHDSAVSLFQFPTVSRQPNSKLGLRERKCTSVWGCTASPVRIGHASTPFFGRSLKNEINRPRWMLYPLLQSYASVRMGDPVITGYGSGMWFIPTWGSINN